MDVIDRAQEYEERARAAALSRFQRRAPEKVDLRRRRECEDCADPIEKARLRAVPEATRCMRCEQAVERRRARA